MEEQQVTKIRSRHGDTIHTTHVIDNGEVVEEIIEMSCPTNFKEFLRDY